MLGFSIDSCFVKYNMQELTKLVVDSLLSQLHDSCKGYPSQVKQFDYKRNAQVCLNNAIWDIEHGTILKVGEDGKITHAIHGFEPLSSDQISRVYGPDRQFTNGKHMTFLSFFESCRIPIVCQLVHMIKNKTLQKTYEDVAFDLYQLSHH